MVSYYFHKSKHHPSFNSDISSFIRSKVFGVAHIVKYINSWSKYLANNEALIVSYEDMLGDPNKTFANILSFLNIEIDKTNLTEIINNIDNDNPDDAIPTLNRLLNNQSYSE